MITNGFIQYEPFRTHKGAFEQMPKNALLKYMILQKDREWDQSNQPELFNNRLVRDARWVQTEPDLRGSSRTVHQYALFTIRRARSRGETTWAMGEKTGALFASIIDERTQRQTARQVHDSPAI